MRTHGAILALLLALSGSTDAAPPPRPRPRLIGVSQGDRMTFVMAPDGSALSIIYDDAILTVPPRPAKAKVGDVMARTGSFTLVRSATPAVARLWIGGFAVQTTGSETLTVDVDRRRVADLSASVGANDFVVCLDVPLTAASTRLSWTARIVVPENGITRSIRVETIDVALLDKGAAPLKGGHCPTPPAKP